MKLFKARKIHIFDRFDYELSREIQRGPILGNEIADKTVIEIEDAVVNGSDPKRPGDRVEKRGGREGERAGGKGGEEGGNAERISGGQKASGAIE